MRRAGIAVRTKISYSKPTLISLRGHFVPWAHLEMPEATRAYRFVYPILLCASYKKAFLFDVTTGALTQTIEDTRGDNSSVALGHICYVDLSAQYAIICFENEVRLYDRSMGGRLALSISTNAWQRRPPMLGIQLATYPGMDRNRSVLTREYVERLRPTRQDTFHSQTSCFQSGMNICKGYDGSDKLITFVV
jgi:hypothetical protein